MNDEPSAITGIHQISTTSLNLRKAQAMEIASRGGPIMPARPMVDLEIVKNTYRSILLSSPSSDEMLVSALLFYVGPMSLEDIRQVVPEGRWPSSMGHMVDLGTLIVLDKRRAERAVDMRLSGSWESRPIAGRQVSPRPPSRREAIMVCRWCADMVKARRIEADAAAFGTLGWIKQSILGNMTSRKSLPRKQELIDATEEIAKWHGSSSLPEPPGWAVTRMWLRSVAEQSYPPEIVPFWPE